MYLRSLARERTVRGHGNGRRRRDRPEVLIITGLIITRVITRIDLGQVIAVMVTEEEMEEGSEGEMEEGMEEEDMEEEMEEDIGAISTEEAVEGIETIITEDMEEEMEGVIETIIAEDIRKGTEFTFT